MKLSKKDAAKFTVLCAIALAVISGGALAQQPTHTSTTISPDVSERERILLERIERLERSIGADGQTTAVMRILLERIERLERRLKEMESCPNAAESRGKADAPTAQPPRPANVTPQQNPLQPTDTTAPRQQPTQTNQATRTATPPAPPPYAAWDKGGVKIIPYGILIANVDYNTSTLDPGSFSAFALPKLLPDQKQFHISPGNSYVGFDVKWAKIGKWEINGKMDIDLRGVAPLKADNIFQPQFLNIYVEAKTERYRILAGQTIDVVAPLFPTSLNIYPISFMPGSLGYVRPQIRFETYQPISGDYTFIFQGAVAQPIQTLEVSNEVFGRQTGLPDGQARFALGYGKPISNGLLQKRPFELGVSGHLGRRCGTSLTVPVVERDFTSWSGTVDLGFNIGRRLRFEGEFFGGSVLGDFAGGVFQTFNTERGVAIRAAGAWAQLTYDISDKWQVNGGYGRDDPYNRDLSFGRRSLNEMGFGNLFYKITSRLRVALEFSRWRTTWVGLPTGSAFRVEPAMLFFF